MLLKDDKKRLTTIIAGAQGMSNAPTNEMGDEVDSEMGLQSAAEEIVQAIESKNASALKAALKSFIEMCDYEEDASEGE